MHRRSAYDAKNGFGRLIDLARAEPVAVEKRGQSVLVAIAVSPAKWARNFQLRGPKNLRGTGDWCQIRSCPEGRREG